MGLRMKNCNIMGVHWKIRFLGREGGEGHEKPIYRGELPVKGGGEGLGQFADLRWGACQRKGGNNFKITQSIKPLF